MHALVSLGDGDTWRLRAEKWRRTLVLLDPFGPVRNESNYTANENHPTNTSLLLVAGERGACSLPEVEGANTTTPQFTIVKVVCILDQNACHFRCQHLHFSSCQLPPKITWWPRASKGRRIIVWSDFVGPVHNKNQTGLSIV